MAFPFLSQPCDTVCTVCALKVPTAKTSPWTVRKLEDTAALIPRLPHPRQQLVHGMLLNVAHINLADDSHHLTVCASCNDALVKDRTPPLSLANGLWIGEVPSTLKALSTAEKFLIARSTPVKSVFTFDDGTVQHSISLQPNDGIIHLPLDDVILPRTISELKCSVILQSTDIPSTPIQLPTELNVDRHSVRLALLWLKSNNDLYANCIISEDRLSSLPVGGLPIHMSDDIVESRPLAFPDLPLADRELSLKPTFVKFHVENPFQLLTGFPVLFPYGMGAPYGQMSDTSFTSHILWFIMYGDGRFEDPAFLQYMFDVFRRRQVHRATDHYEPKVMPIHNFDQRQNALRALLHRTSLRNESVSGSDEGKFLLVQRVSAMMTALGPPTLTLTMNAPLSESTHCTVHDVLTFHHLLSTLLSKGIAMAGGRQRRKKPLLSDAAGYIGDIRTDRFGKPKLFLIVWLKGGPTTRAPACLSFQERLKIIAQRPRPPHQQHLLPSRPKIVHFSHDKLIRLVGPSVKFHIFMGPDYLNDPREDSAVGQFLGRPTFLSPTVNTVKINETMSSLTNNIFLLDREITTATAIVLNLNRVPSSHLIMRLLLGLDDCVTSHKFVYLHWDNIVDRLVHAFPHLEAWSEGSSPTSTWTLSISHLDHYSQRLPEFAAMSCYEFLLKTHFVTQDGVRLRVLRKSKRPISLCFRGGTFPSSDEGELYHMSVLLMFRPWEQLGDLLWGYESFHFLNTATTDIHRLLTNFQYMHDCKSYR